MLRKTTPQLFEMSPVWDFWGDALVGYDLAMTAGFSLRGFHPLFYDGARRESISAGIGKMLAATPDNTVLRFYSIELGSYADDLARYRASFDKGIGKDLAEEKVKLLANVNGPVRRELLCFASTPGRVKGVSLAPSTLKSGFFAMQRLACVEMEEQKEKLVSVTQSLTANLRQLGVKVDSLDKQGAFRHMWRLANPLRSLMFDAPTMRDDLSLRTQLFASGIENDTDFYVRDGQLQRVVSLILPPQSVSPAEILKLQDLPFRNFMVVTLRRIPQAKAKKKVDGSRFHAWQLRSLAKHFQGQRAEENPDHDTLNKQSASNAVSQCLAHGDSLFEAAIQIWFCAADKLQLDRQTEHLLSVVKNCGGAEGAIEEYRAPFAYVSMLPGHHLWMGKRYHNMLGSRAADLVPIFQEPAGTKDPSYLFTTRGNALFGWSPFMKGLNSHNGIVLGTTGAGKSFWVRCAISGYLAQGGRAIIITRGGDYHRYAEMYKGDIHDVRLEDPNLALGPFLPKAAMEDADDMDHLASILAMMATEHGKELGRVEERLIFEACRKLYARWTNEEAPTLREWITVLRSIGEARDLDKEAVGKLESCMLYWLEGPESSIFARNRRPTDANLQLWNIEHIKRKALQSVVLGMISADIARMVKLGRLFVFTDECWDVLNNPVGARNMEATQRTIRKQKGAMWSGSQSINDFTNLGDSLKSVMLSCSNVLVLLQQMECELPEIQRLLQLDDATMAVVKSLRTVIGKQSSALLALGDQKQVVNLVPSPTEYWMATSHPIDVDVETNVRKRYPHHSRTAVVKALAAKLPKGAAHVS